MRALRFSPVIHGIEIGYGPFPGQAVDKSNQRRVVAIDADLGKAARPGIQIDARDADILRCRQPVILIDGLIAIPYDAEAEFRYQRRAEDVRVVEPRALIARRPGSGKAAVMRTAVNAAVGPIKTRVGYIRGLIAVAHEEPVAGRRHVIDLDVELIDVLDLGSSFFEVGHEPGPGGRR